MSEKVNFRNKVFSLYRDVCSFKSMTFAHLTRDVIISLMGMIRFRWLLLTAPLNRGTLYTLSFKLHLVLQPRLLKTQVCGVEVLNPVLNSPYKYVFGVLFLPLVLASEVVGGNRRGLLHTHHLCLC